MRYHDSNNRLLALEQSLKLTRSSSAANPSRSSSRSRQHNRFLALQEQIGQLSQPLRSQAPPEPTISYVRLSQRLAKTQKLKQPNSVAQVNEPLSSALQSQVNPTIAEKRAEAHQTISYQALAQKLPRWHRLNHQHGEMPPKTPVFEHSLASLETPIDKPVPLKLPKPAPDPKRLSASLEPVSEPISPKLPVPVQNQSFSYGALAATIRKTKAPVVKEPVFPDNLPFTTVESHDDFLAATTFIPKTSTPRVSENQLIQGQHFDLGEDIELTALPLIPAFNQSPQPIVADSLKPNATLILATHSEEPIRVLTTEVDSVKRLVPEPLNYCKTVYYLNPLVQLAIDHNHFPKAELLCLPHLKNPHIEALVGQNHTSNHKTIEALNVRTNAKILPSTSFFQLCSASNTRFLKKNPLYCLPNPTHPLLLTLHDSIEPKETPQGSGLFSSIKAKNLILMRQIKYGLATITRYLNGKIGTKILTLVKKLKSSVTIPSIVLNNKPKKRFLTTTKSSN
jgi:hypothetical protein